MSYLFRDEYVLPSESHSSRSPFRWRNVQKQLTRNTAREKRTRQDDVDSVYLFVDAKKETKNHTKLASPNFSPS
jgi:hypothetical protein